ncbi:MAG: heparinase II/III family protein, partial [Alphaproteobacteria bacterium]
GALGPDHLPGHAHGDIFSFELSLGGRRVIVDSGTYDYVASEMRAYCRSTAAHNTVTVDGADQAEFWAAFRVGRRGRPRDVVHARRDDGFELSGWHDGFRHLPGQPVHRRRFRWHDSGVLVVRDEVSAECPVSTTARIHLHPDCRIVESGDRVVRLAREDVAFTFAVLEGPGPSVADSWYCPRFGVRERNQVLVLESRAVSTNFAWAVAKGHDVEVLPQGEGIRAGGRAHAA